MRLEASQVERLAADIARQTVAAVERQPGIALRPEQATSLESVYHGVALDTYDRVVAVVNQSDLDDAAKEAEVKRLVIAGQERSTGRVAEILDPSQYETYRAWEQKTGRVVPAARALVRRPARAERWTMKRALWLAVCMMLGAGAASAEGLDWEVEESADASAAVRVARNVRDGVLGFGDAFFDANTAVFGCFALAASQLFMGAGDLVGLVDDNPVTQHVSKGVISKNLAKVAYLWHVAGAESLLGSHGLEVERWADQRRGHAEPAALRRRRRRARGPAAAGSARLRGRVHVPRRRVPAGGSLRRPRRGAARGRRHAPGRERAAHRAAARAAQTPSKRRRPTGSGARWTGAGSAPRTPLAHAQPSARAARRVRGAHARARARPRRSRAGTRTPTSSRSRAARSSPPIATTSPPSAATSCW